jgi:hypothetical protein
MKHSRRGSGSQLRRRRRGCRAWAGVGLLALGAIAGGAWAQTTQVERAPDTASETLTESAKGHGAISIAYVGSLSKGLRINQDTIAPVGNVHSRAIALDLDYYFADDWSAHIGIPYVSNRYDGGAPHCPTTVPVQCANRPPLSPPHPESRFLDDGRYHGTFQNWTFGAAYHANIDDYLLSPSITAIVPSHDYTFFANAAVAQRIWEVEVATTLAHQFDFSNLYYRIGYGYVFTEKTLTTDVSHHKVNLELGYFVNERFSVRGFGIGRVGHGYAAGHLIPLTAGQTNELWYHHDQISEHNYFSFGAGFDYDLADRYTLSGAVQRLVWGQTVFNFKYATELRLTRSF